MGNLWNGCWKNYRLGYSRKKNRVLRIWNFQGYWRNGKWIFNGLIKNNVEFLVVLVLGLKFSKGWKNYLCSFSRWSLVLSGISRGEVKKLKIPGGFSKKLCPQLPLFVFFWNSQYTYTLIHNTLGSTCREVFKFQR